MPPADKKQLSDGQRGKVLAFIESKVFKIDHENPDPGRVTIRRLNREEYRYTIKDLLNIDFGGSKIFFLPMTRATALIRLEMCSVFPPY